MQVRRLSDEGLGVVRVMQRLGGGVAMLANATCCPLHRNAEIAQDANDVVWTRLVADVRAGDEILVDYGRGFFASELCACCSCGWSVEGGASGEGGRARGRPEGGRRRVGWWMGEQRPDWV